MNLRTLLKELFFKHHILTARKAQEYLHLKGLNFSLVALYVELKYFQRTKMVIKEKTRYILSIGWVLDAQLSLEQVYRELLRSPYFDLSLIGTDTTARKRKRTWTFSSLLQMNEFWVQLIFTLASRDRTQPVLEYIPHLWFAFIQPEQDSRFQRAFKSQSFDIRILVGGDTYLDREPFNRKGEKPSYRCVYRTTPLHSKRNTCYCIIADWLITISCPDLIAHQMDRLFEASSKSVPFVDLWRILNERGKITLSLERKSAAWARIRRIFKAQELCE